MLRPHIICINTRLSRNTETQKEHKMLLADIAKQLLQREQKVPEQYMRMVQTEFRSVPTEYVEYFLQKNKRLPTTEELQHAV